MNLSSMELKSSRLDFLEIPTGTSSNQRPRLSKTSSNPKTQRKLWHGASLPPLPPLGASWFVVSSCFLFGLLLHVSSGLFFFFVWSRFLGFFLLGLGFFFVWSLYGNWVYNARFPCIELKLVMLDLAQQNRVPHTRNVSLLNSFENMLTNEIVWVLVLFWKKKSWTF